MSGSDLPEIDGGAFRLRALRPADIPGWYAWLSLPGVLDHTSWSLASADDLRPLVDPSVSDAPNGKLRLAIESVADARFVGTIGFHSISPSHRTAEIAYDLDPAHWGRGIATRCCRAVVAWGLQTRGFVRIQACALESNLGSIRVLEKCGFECEGTLRNFRLVRGVPRSFRMYSRIPDGARNLS